VAWDWSHALLGVVYAVPAAGLAMVDPAQGLAAAVGMIPAAAAGLAGPRRARLATAVVGALAGVSMLVGSLLTQVPILAVPAIFLLCVGAAVVAPRGKLGRIALGLCLPLVGLGLSYDDPRDTLGIALLMTLGSVYAFVVSLAWPARPAAQPVSAARAGGRPMLGYGILLGLAAAIAAAIGFRLQLDHVGWACGAALLVMRPAPKLAEMRGIDRVVSVFLGAAAGSGLVLLDLAPAVIAAALVVALAGMAGTHGSLRYVTPLFTTFLVFLLLLVDNPQDLEGRFLERMGETALGVGLALIFGVLVPMIIPRVATNRRAS
jgi:hypothetical protein